MFRFLTIDNFTFKDKLVAVRVDINSPMIKGKVMPNERIVAHAKTIKELSDKGARVLILAHQGRKGKDDCISLKNHVSLLEKEIKKKIRFEDDIYSLKTLEKIRELEEGDILLLENLRFFSDEEDFSKHNNKILALEDILDFYVQDAFSVSHRSQTSITGITKVPMIAGRVMEKELLGLNEIMETKRPHVFLFGGAKPDDLIELLEPALRKDEVDMVLLSGVIGELALSIQGHYLGKKLDFLKEHHFTDKVDVLRKLLLAYPDKFFLPSDLAIVKGKKRVEIRVNELEKHKELLDENLTQDIGKDTVKNFSQILQGAGSIYIKGPAGNFEEGKSYEYGTKEVFKAVIKSGAFTFMGGGHSVTAANMYVNTKKFDYISLAGGALVHFLSGKELPGVMALERSFEFYEKVYEDFVVVGSNTIDISVNMDEHSFADIELGDKIKIHDDFRTTVGGGGINVSICLSKLGAKVGYLGKMSHESFTQVKDVLDKNKVTLIASKVSRRPAAKSIVLDTKDHDRVIFTYRGQNAYLQEDDFYYETFKSKNFYFSSLSGESFETLVKMAKRIKKMTPEASICYNPSSYLIKEEKKKLKGLISYSDILILNYSEAQALVGAGTISSCLRNIKRMVTKVVVITDGANGAYAFDGKKEYFQKAFPPKRVVDTTGAGDAFVGTFFYFYVKGYGIQKSLTYAARNSSSLISHKGSQEGLLGYKDLLA